MYYYFSGFGEHWLNSFREYEQRFSESWGDFGLYFQGESEHYVGLFSQQ